MRKLTIALLAGLTVFGAAGTASAQTRPYGDRDRDGVPNRVDNNDKRPNAQYRDNDRDGIPNKYDANDRRPAGYGDRDRDGVPNRYDRNDNRARAYGDRDRNDYSRGFGYNSGWNYNDRWTPYGWGYNDRNTRAFVSRYYGSLNERNWRRAQTDFYRFADRNRDGRIDRREYDWAMGNMNRYRRY